MSTSTSYLGIPRTNWPLRCPPGVGLPRIEPSSRPRPRCSLPLSAEALEPVRNSLRYCSRRGFHPPTRVKEAVTPVKNVQEPAERVVANVERVIIGKHAEVRMALVALLCEGHILIEDVPGVGKTMLAKALSKSIGCSFRRIQFTPDLLPSDVTGLSIYNQKTQEFEFRPGPIMAQVVLADEINRATPKTQSALLECMEEHQATIDGVSHPMETPFLVIATQNPIEYEGTFALPEAQLDRFMLRLRIGYPKPMEEIVILDEQKRVHPIEAIHQVLDVDELRQMQTAIKEVYVDQAVAEYIVRLVTATREHPDVYLGASPRGSINLYRSSQAFAAMEGRDYVIPDDVKSLGVAILAHRLIVKSQASLREIDPDRIVREILASVPVAAPTTATSAPATAAS
jgi:MoxR-like ATPase